MYLNEFTISKMIPLVNGEKLGDGSNITPNKSGPKLITLFNKYGLDIGYDYWKEKGLPGNLSRSDYTKLCMKKINGTKSMKMFINDFIHSKQFFESEFKVEPVIEYLTPLLGYDGYKLIKVGGEYKVSGEGLVEEGALTITPTFENIQSQILKEIKRAKYLIWVAVAWFTDEEIFNVLKEKSLEGVNVQLIISDDEINRGSKLNYQEYFETYLVEPFGPYSNNIMHHKFCIIDLNTVIQGSYNWSKKAQYNGENIDTVTNPSHALQYANRFIKLKQKAKLK